MSIDFDFDLILQSLPRLFDGAVLTIQLTVFSVLAGLCLAVPLSVWRHSKNIWIAMPVSAFTYIFRGTPLLIQLYLIYYGLAQFGWIKSSFLWDFLREGYWCFLLALTLNNAAYSSEILSGAIQNVPRGEIEAARAVGMPEITLLRRIVLPQALRLVLPAYSNEVVLMLQATSLASLVTLMDLTGVARAIVAASYAVYELYITIGIIYIIITYGIVWLFRIWERYLMRHVVALPFQG